MPILFLIRENQIDYLDLNGKKYIISKYDDLITHQYDDSQK
jgi:hypothetical protein